MSIKKFLLILLITAGYMYAINLAPDLLNIYNDAKMQIQQEKEIYFGSSPILAITQPDQVPYLTDLNRAVIFALLFKDCGEKLTDCHFNQTTKDSINKKINATYDEIDIYLGRSLVEGNQILESRFLAGDKEVVDSLQSKKVKFDSPERELKNIIFKPKEIQLFVQRSVRTTIRNSLPRSKSA